MKRNIILGVVSMIALASILVGGSIVGIGFSKTLAQGTNATNAKNTTSASGGGIPVTYPLESHYTTYQKLSDNEIKSQVSKLQGWSVVNGKLSKSFEFKNFVEAFSFMTKVASFSKILLTYHFCMLTNEIIIMNKNI